MAERDYPVGHPAASDYKGEKYVPPRAPWTDDYRPDDPARGGRNTSEADTPDGARKASIRQWHANVERTRDMAPQQDAADEQQPVASDTAASTTITISGNVENT